jgi:hypothetical protein
VDNSESDCGRRSFRVAKGTKVLIFVIEAIVTFYGLVVVALLLLTSLWTLPLVLVLLAAWAIMDLLAFSWLFRTALSATIVDGYLLARGWPLPLSWTIPVGSITVIRWPYTGRGMRRFEIVHFGGRLLMPCQTREVGELVRRLQNENDMIELVRAKPEEWM